MVVTYQKVKHPKTLTSYVIIPPKNNVATDKRDSIVCPLCGGEMELYGHKSFVFYFYKCKSCGATLTCDD